MKYQEKIDLNVVFPITKYITFFKIRFLTGLQYRSAALAGVVTQFAWGFLELLMFQAFYESGSGVFPMGMEQLAAYVWLQQAFLSLYMIWYWEGDIFNSIRNGDVAYELCRPISIYNMWFTKCMGSRISKAVLRCVPILFLACFLPYPFGLKVNIGKVEIIFFILSMTLALLVSVAFSMVIYMLTFFTTNQQGLQIVAASLAEFFGGAVIPIPFFPEKLQKVLNLLPFASMQNIPFRIFSGNIRGVFLYESVAMQITWVVILLLLGKYLEKKALQKICVLGG